MISLSLNLSYAKTVRDVVESVFIFNAIAEGKGLFCGHLLYTNFDSSEQKKYDSDSALFWEKLLNVETVLGVVFKLPREDIDFSAFRVVEILYKNLVQNLPIRDNTKIESLDGEWEMKDDFSSFIGKSLYFEFKGKYHISLFGVEKDLPCIIGIFDSKIINYTIKERKYKLMLDHMSEDRHMYKSMLCFANEFELQSHLNNDIKDIRKALQSAKTPEEFLAEKGN